jgi:hypothetical protein
VATRSCRMLFPLCGISILDRFLFSIHFARSAILSLIAPRSASRSASHGALNYASRKPAGEPGGEVDLNQPSTERRRSERVSESFPLIVRGIDLLGQPFEERTTTLAFNLHGCRYTSKHHLPRNTWVTLDLPQGVAQDVAQRLAQANAGTNTGANSTGNSCTTLRARVAWVQRPHSIRDFFQVAVELESPANIWGTDAAELNSAAAAISESVASPARSIPRFTEQPPTDSAAGNLGNFMNYFKAEASTEPGIDSQETHAAPEPAQELALEAAQQSEAAAPAANNPLLRELRAELDRQAKDAVLAAAEQAREEVLQTAAANVRERNSSAEELFAKWKREIEKMQAGARDEFFAQVAAKQDEALGALKSGFDEKFGQARELLDEIARQGEALRAESGRAQEATSQVARVLLQLEAAEAARSTRSTEPSKEEIAARDSAVAIWRQRLESEMTVAQGQWNELLQSSLDNNLHRMVDQLSERSQEVLRNAEQKMTERLGELRQPFAQAAAEARETFSGIQSALEQEVLKARNSLAEVKQVANRTEEFSAQLEAASQDTVNELHRRLERILDAQAAEMNRRMENLSADLTHRAIPVLDSLSHQFQERAVAEAEAKLAPHLERVPALLNELAAREVQLEDSLRLHRERLRQVSENNQREVGTQVAATLASLHTDFEAARKDALAKWSEELDASGVRASHAAAESIGHTSEWLQQEARARLQALVEQSFVTAEAGFGQRSAEAAQKFEAQLAAQSAAHLGQIRAQVEGIAGEVTARTRTDLDRAAEAAAASFGQLLHEVSERETTQFAATTATTRRERSEEFDHATQQLLHQLDTNAFSSVERLRAQMASQWDASVGEGRAALGAEFASALEGFRTERDAHQNEWTAQLEHVSGEAAGKFQDRLQTTADSWVMASVRRLNEHGQNGIESLLRTADQALRESCSKVFDGLAQMLRERATNVAGAGGVAGFTQAANRDTPEPPNPRSEAQ